MTYYGGARPALADWELAELRRRASTILAEYPAWHMPWRHHEGRNARLAQLASEYGINVRTVYRYLRREGRHD